jgi:glycyl-tRNA synthetase beta chain
VPDAGAYLGLLRNADVEPDADERERRIRDGLDAIGEWSDPLRKLDEVLYMVESVRVLPGEFDERFLALPRRVIETAMQSHQRYFPLEGNRFAFVANGGDPETVTAGNRQVLENRLADAEFTFERDRRVGIEGLASRLSDITFFQGAGSFVDKTERVVDLVRKLGGGEASVEAARLAKADQAAELVREYPDLEGHIGAEYARLAGYPEAVSAAIDEQYLPDGQDAPLPGTEGGKVLSAADKIDTLHVSFGLGHKPTGSRDPYGLRRAAIGLCRLADEGGLTVPRDLLRDDVRDFVEETARIAARRARRVRPGRPTVGDDRARRRRLARAAARGAARRPTRPYSHGVHASGAARGRRRGRRRPGAVGRAGRARACPGPPGHRSERRAARSPQAFAAAADLAPVVERFFEDVLVMAEDSAIRANRLALLAQVRDEVGRLGDFSQIPR